MASAGSFVAAAVVVEVASDGMFPGDSGIARG